MLEASKMKKNTKIIVLVGDGMGDYPLRELGGKTPLEAARTPNMDRLLRKGRMGMLRTIPESMEPGSDVANMSLLGYDPLMYHTGRAPLEAASMGVALDPEDVAFRCNLVTLAKNESGTVMMEDYSAGHISTAEAQQLIAALQEAVSGTPLRLYPGVSYRHLLVWGNGRQDLKTTPPHDISGEPVEPYAEVYRKEPILHSFVVKAANILVAHPVNRDRRNTGKRIANSVWLWGQGKAPVMPTLQEKAGLTGAMISAVDLLKGLGVYAGLEPVSVAGATGYLDTNYAGKVNAALTALEHGDFVYVHLEAPDEAGHEGSLSKKMEAIEAFDERVVGPLVQGARQFADVRLLLVTDHLTPIEKRTHVADPVPFVLVHDLNGPETASDAAATFCERTARTAGWQVQDGAELFAYLTGSATAAPEKG
jgi:2,3-bisphosphoglycerate-independent phosphoglycerate mutase